MRFKIRNWDIVDDNVIRAGGYATGINRSVSNEQFQIIIGADVPKFYQAFCEVNGYEDDGKTIKNKNVAVKVNPNDVDFKLKQQAEIDGVKSKVRGKGWFSKGLAFISAVFTPIVIPLVGYGLIMTIWSLMTVEWNGAGSSLKDASHFFAQVVSILDILVGAFSLFITISIGYTVFKAMKGNVIYGIIIAVVLTAPGLVQMGDVTVPDGESILGVYPGWTLFGDGMTYPWKINYNGLIIPMILVVVVGAYIERATERIQATTLKMIVAPILVIGGAFIFGVFIMAPVGLLFTNYLSIGIDFLSTNYIAKYIAIPVIGALYGPLVITGMHHSITPIILQGQAQYGATSLQGFITISNISQGVASIAFVVLYRRVRKMKDLGVSNGVSAIVGGITEPSLYTINLKHLFPLIGASIGVFAGTLIMTASNTYALQGASSIFGILMFLQAAPDATGVTTWAGGGFLWGTISVLTAAGVAFGATYFLGKLKFFADRSKAIINSEYGDDVDQLNAIPKGEWKIIIQKEKAEKAALKAEDKKQTSLDKAEKAKIKQAKKAEKASDKPRPRA
ncbi:hypothetical protein [[Acholeplasma] multilocale]|uniref:hypothetical protein n=1 Tax=[Acholeplasma] multilocale TaxID=264638 RepID=UPI00047A56C0|nr:hypothetical protein [[Acholeplasma] multilocale]